MGDRFGGVYMVDEGMDGLMEGWSYRVEPRHKAAALSLAAGASVPTGWEDRVTRGPFFGRSPLAGFCLGLNSVWRNNSNFSDFQAWFVTLGRLSTLCTIFYIELLYIILPDINTIY